MGLLYESVVSAKNWNINDWSREYLDGRGDWKLKVKSVKEHQQRLDGRGGCLEGAEAEGEGAPEFEGGRQGGETSDKSIEMHNENILLF